MFNLFLSDKNAEILIQGITGKEGSRMCRWMKSAGAKVVAGVSPGKQGEEVEGVPVYADVAAAMRAHPAIAISCVAIPAQHVRTAVTEALTAGVRLVHILSENVPVHDVIFLREQARATGAMILGPASVGAIFSSGLRIGYLGGENPFGSPAFSQRIGLLSTSGGMANEILKGLHRGEMDVHIALALGGGRVTGLSLQEAFKECQVLPGVKTLMVFAEPSQPILNLLSSGILQVNKPTILFLPGEMLEVMPQNIPYGHTGTILGEGATPVKDIRKQLEARGVSCPLSIKECVSLAKKYVS